MHGIPLIFDSLFGILQYHYPILSCFILHLHYREELKHIKYNSPDAWQGYPVATSSVKTRVADVKARQTYITLKLSRSLEAFLLIFPNFTCDPVTKIALDGRRFFVHEQDIGQLRPISILAFPA